MRIVKYYISWFFFAFLAFAACKEDPIVENPSGETIIYNAYISNGGLSGGTRYDGVVDEAAKIVTFSNVAAETDIQHIKFNGKISLGAHFDKESYDFLEGQSNPDAATLNGIVGIVSGENVSDYKVVINLAEAESAPMVNKIEVETASGKVVNGSIDLIEKWIYLNTPNETEVTVKNIILLPARTSCTFTDAVNNKLNKSNPGYLQLDFWGKTDSYRISFDNAPAVGINFGAPIVHDFSVKTGNMYPDFSAELVRSADFDGEYVLLVSRDGGTKPKLLSASDILADKAPVPILLSTSGIKGGTYEVSAGRLSQGHVYICNLSTGLANTDAGKLKLYHWDTPNSAPEQILEFDGVVDENTNLAGQRYGDNISVDLDEDGNGYIFFIQGSEPATCNILRFTVTGFRTVDNPKIIASIGSLTYYPAYNEIYSTTGDPTGQYLVKGTYTTVLRLMDKDAKELYQVNMADLTDIDRGTDPRIINYNSGRYLIMTSGRRYAYWPASTLLVFDISRGFDATAALVELNDSKPVPVFTYEMDAPLSTAPSANTAWAAVNGKLVLFTAAPHCGFALIEFPKNQK